MTRRSKREIDRALDDLGPVPGESTLQQLWIASLKRERDAELSAYEQRLLDEPRQHLSEQGRRRLARLRSPQDGDRR
ncbi:hypothetical protein NDI54_05905 [Haloarcula sp. S1AR25-5A]|uniref:Uncharacterized protein n=1 Tax=Haloarcula terrestris TaxID=2950533 RepID=A0AAE4EY74_9EURY|nr:hypothetical protein [Haloarcula terrestris]MDS0220888.1 hypothetical protein [Haloarcula terrestris]